jgi:hypothetical protein
VGVQDWTEAEKERIGGHESLTKIFSVTFIALLPAKKKSAFRRSPKVRGKKRKKIAA